MTASSAPRGPAEPLRELQCADEVIHEPHVWERSKVMRFRCPGWPRRRPPARGPEHDDTTAIKVVTRGSRAPTAAERESVRQIVDTARVRSQIEEVRSASQRSPISRLATLALLDEIDRLRAALATTAVPGEAVNDALGMLDRYANSACCGDPDLVREVAANLRRATTADTDPLPSDDTMPDDLADRLWTAATNGNADTFDEVYEQVLLFAGTHDTAVVDLQALTEVVATLKEVATKERWHEGSRGWRIIHEMDRGQRAGAARAYSAVVARRASGDHPAEPERAPHQVTTDGGVTVPLTCAEIQHVVDSLPAERPTDEQETS